VRIDYHEPKYWDTTGKRASNMWASVHCSDGQYWHVYIGPTHLPAEEIQNRKILYVYNHIARGTVR